MATEIKNVWGFKPHFPYRISKMVEKPELSGKTVIFQRLTERFGCVWAVVNLMLPDGSNGDEWLVKPRWIIPIR